MKDLTGRCFCGAVRYRARSRPEQVNTCYCADCTRVVGSAMTTWARFRADDFEFTLGDPIRFESPGITRTFCGSCGTSLTYHYKSGAQVDVTTATLDDPEAYPPTRDGPGRPSWIAHLV